MLILTLARIVVVAVISTCSAHGLQLDQLRGDWTGKRKETRNGVGYSWSVNLDLKEGADGGLVMIEKGKSPNSGMYTNRHIFRSNGKYSSSAVTSSGFCFMKKSEAAMTIFGTTRHRR